MAHDLTVHDIGRIDIEDADDIVVFVAPVYAGRVPALAAERFLTVNGHGQKAAAIAVYGNRDYDDALVEMCDIISARGFKLIAAGAFIAQHCIFPKVATDPMPRTRKNSPGTHRLSTNGLSATDCLI